MEEKRSRDPFDFMLNDKRIEMDEHESNQPTREYDQIDHFMFGGQREKEKGSENKSSLSGILGQIDVIEVLNHVDTLMTSAKELKPLLGKVKPLFDQIIDKNKS